MFLSLLGWTSDPGFIVRIHAQEFNSFQRRSRSKRLRDFHLCRQEKFLYICSPLDLWEWELRVLDVAEEHEADQGPRCLSGRGAVPPEQCSGPVGYRLMLKRQQAGPAIRDPAVIEASMKLLADVYQDEPDIDWAFFQEAVSEGWGSVEARVEQSGPLEPTRFHLTETNTRVAEWAQRRRWWP